MSSWSRSFPQNLTLDFRVSAFIGGYTGTPLTSWEFNGENSGWSSTQSITLDFNTPVSKYVPSSEEMYGIVTYASPQATPTITVTPQPSTTNTPTESAASPTAQPTQTAPTPTQQTTEAPPPSAFNPLLIIAVVAVLAVVIILVVIIIKRHQTS